jgi:hypothetical protein
MDDIKIQCHYCREFFFFGQLTKDHVVPKSKGGRDIVENIVPSCGTCNQAKGDNMPDCPCAFCKRAVDYFEQQFDGMAVVRKTWESPWNEWRKSERKDSA